MTKIVKVLRNCWSYCIPTKIVFGIGCLKRITSIVESLQARRILLITGSESMKKLRVTRNVISQLRNYQVIVYDGVKQNPTVDSVENGIRFLRNEKCDLVIGLGGGSVIDTAKAVSVLYKNRGRVNSYLLGDRKILTKGLPLIAIPTTSGTGTEVTQYASIIDEKKKQKLSLSHEYIHPEIAIIDPILTITVPKNITAFTGLDALSQCIEAYWSKNHTPISDVFALKGISLIFENLSKAFNFPENIKFRERMALASLFSGIAISITKTTIVHSVSYPLTVLFGIPHGLACALTLPSFLRYNSEAVEDRIYDIARIIDVETTDELIQKVEELILSLETPRRLSSFGIKDRDIEIIVRAGFRPDRAENNPRKVTRKDLKTILENLM